MTEPPIRSTGVKREEPMPRFMASSRRQPSEWLRTGKRERRIMLLHEASQLRRTTAGLDAGDGVLRPFESKSTHVLTAGLLFKTPVWCSRLMSIGELAS